MIRTTARLRSKTTATETETRNSSPNNNTKNTDLLPPRPEAASKKDFFLHMLNMNMAKIPENDSSVEPLEISDEDDQWRNMTVRSSQESSITGKRCLSIIVAALALFFLVFFVLFEHDSSRLHVKNYNTGGSSNSNGNNNSKGNHLFAPIFGQAYLTSDEFRDIRPAHAEESVLITGGLGFIGSHVTDLLLHRGFKVTILDDESNGHNHNRFAKELVPHDITVVKDFPKFPTDEGDESDENVGSFTHVIHLAAAISVAESMNDPDKYERINYEGSQKVLDWINEYNIQVQSQSNDDAPTPIKKLVAASSAAIYGDPDPSLLPLKESTAYGGKSPYADTKYRMEGLMREFVAKQKDAETPTSTPASAIALRFFNVYGPRQDPKNPYSGVISLFLEAAMTGQDVTVLGDGEMTRDFVYVKDVARAIVLALLQEDQELHFDVFNVCTGSTITINTLAEQVKKSMDSQSEIVHLDPREGDIRDSSCNPDGAKGGIGFVSAVSQETGLKKTADWFQLEDKSRILRGKRRLEEMMMGQGYELQ